MNNAIIYGDALNSETNPSGHRLAYFYLHGNAEMKNGYDCCNGNIEAFALALKNFIFFAELQYFNGEKETCLVFTYISDNGINGYIVLPDDLVHLKDAMSNRQNNISWAEHDRKRMKEDYPNTYTFIKNLQK